VLFRSETKGPRGNDRTPQVQKHAVRPEFKSQSQNKPIVYRAEGTPLGLFGWVAKIFRALIGSR
jgi:hypothetical protein